MVGFSRMRRAGLVAAMGFAALALASCSDYVGKIPKHLAPLDSDTKKLVDRKGMDQKAPILIRIFKEESSLEVWKQQKATGRYALLKDYEICKWSGVLGPKIKEGDRQAPEGFYTIRPAQMNPNSSYHLSFNLGYPNDFDRAHGRTGSELMVHGACSSRGCYSMTDEQVQEIYTLGRLAFEGGQRDFQVQAFPFRMTPENMAKHRTNPNIAFWRMLKEGYDHFEAVRQPPKVDVCEKRYVFNSVTPDGAAYSASSACPPLLMPADIRVAVGKKDAEDDREMLKLAARLDRREGTGGATMLAQALAAPTTASLAAPMTIATAPLSLEPATVAANPGAPLDLTGSAAAAMLGAGSAPLPTGPTAADSSETVAAADAEGGSESVVPGPPPATAPAPAFAAVAPEPPVQPAPQSPLSDYEALFAQEPASDLTPPDLRPTEDATPAVQPAPAGPAAVAATAEPPTSEAASLEERMGAVSASDTPSEAAASAYAPQPEKESGLSDFMFRLFE